MPVAGLVVEAGSGPELMEAVRDAGFEEVIVVVAAAEMGTVAVFLGHARSFWHWTP